MNEKAYLANQKTSRLILALQQKRLEDKLDRIIQLLEEMNRLNPKSIYDYVIPDGTPVE